MRKKSCYRTTKHLLTMKATSTADTFKDALTKMPLDPKIQRKLQYFQIISISSTFSNFGGKIKI